MTVLKINNGILKDCFVFFLYYLIDYVDYRAMDELIQFDNFYACKLCTK